MSLLDGHSSGLLKQQTSPVASDGPKASDVNLAKAQILTMNRANMPQEMVSSGYVPVQSGGKAGSSQTTGKTSNSFNAESSGWAEETDEEGKLVSPGAFLSRHTTLPWNSQGAQQQGPQFSSLNFWS